MKIPTLSNHTLKYIIVIAAILLAFIAIPLIFKGVVITAGVLGLALILAAVFVLGMLVAVALLSPLWIPFLAGYAAVKFCKKYYRSDDNVPSEK